MNFICFNGKFLTDDIPVLFADNRNFKWGDGIFETIRVHQGNILLESLHFERLFQSIGLLQIQTPRIHKNELSEKIIELCERNGCRESARVRLSVFRDDQLGASYLINAFALAVEPGLWHKKDLHTDIYPLARKSMDVFSNLKSSSYQTYIMAGLYAQQNNLDDVILLNAAGRICDSSRANVFLIKNNEVFTPALSEGCINGVMRRFFIEQFTQTGLAVQETALLEIDLCQADEVFFTNAIRGIQSVLTFKQYHYSYEQSFSIFRKTFTTIPF